MAYGKSTRYRKKAYRKRNYKKKYPSTKNLDRRIKKIEADKEIKNRDSLITSMTLLGDVTAASTNWTLLNDSLDQGTKVPDRIGDEVRITSVSLRIRLSTDVDEVKTTLVRCMVFWDRQANGLPFGYNGTDPTLGTFGPLIPSGASYVYNHYNPYLCGGRTTRYKMLYDKTFTLQPQGFNSDGTKSYQVVKLIKKKIKVNKIMKYKRGGDGTGNLDQIMSGALWLVLVADPTSSTTAPLAMTSYRLNYADSQ